MGPKFDARIIAPCGMNCGICRAHLRKKNHCPGCNCAGESPLKTCVVCTIRMCDKRSGSFCFTCPAFPCGRLQRLDARYRKRYGMSEIGNLEYIRDNGMEPFLEKEHERWVSGAGILCVHDRNYYPARGDELTSRKNV
jgi:hypothetical protein